jgi:tyrosine-protein kinase Etk/Wzc
MTHDIIIEAEDEISLLGVLVILVDNLRLLLLGPLVAGLVTLGYSFTITPTYTATAKFLPPQQQQSSAAAMLTSLGALSGLAGGLGGIKNPADQYLSFLSSNSLRDALLDRFKLMDRLKITSREKARIAVGNSVRITYGKDGIFTIFASDENPEFAAQLANAHAEELGKLLNRIAVTEAQQRRQFFEKQLANARDNLVQAERALKSSGVNSGALKANPLAAVEGIAKLKAGISAQEIKLGSMRGYLTESAPDFKQAQTDLTVLLKELARAEKEEPAGIPNLGDNDYISKYRSFKYFETLFELFSKQYELARLDESREGAVIQVLDVAEPPEYKSHPMKAQMALLSTFAAGFVLLFFIFVRQIWRGVDQNPNTPENLLRLRRAWAKAIRLT